MSRPELTEREAMLLKALQLMKGWVVQFVEPTQSNKKALLRDLSIAQIAIHEATGGNEQ